MANSPIPWNGFGIKPSDDVVVNDIELNLITPDVDNVKGKFSQGAGFEYTVDGNLETVRLSDGLYRLLPSIDTPLRGFFRKWHTQSSEFETFDENLRRAFRELVKNEKFHDNVYLLMRTLDPIYRESFLRYVDLIKEPPTHCSLSEIQRTDALLTPEFSQLCDDLIATTINYPNLYDYFTRARTSALDIEELVLIAENVIAMSPESRSYLENALAQTRAMIEETIGSAVDTAFGSIAKYEFSVDRIFGCILPREGSLSMPPVPPAVIPNAPVDEPRKLVSQDSNKATHALLAAYSLKCLEFVDAINDVFDTVLLKAESVVAKFGGIENAFPGQLVGESAMIAEFAAIEIEKFLGWDPQQLNWVNDPNPLASQGFRFDGTEVLASKLFGAQLATLDSADRFNDR